MADKEKLWQKYLNMDLQDLMKLDYRGVREAAHSLNTVANQRLNMFRQFYEEHENFPRSYRFRDIYRKTSAGFMENTNAMEGGFRYSNKLEGKTRSQQRNILLNHITILRKFLNGQQGTLDSWIKQITKEENLIRRQLHQPELPEYVPSGKENREEYIKTLVYFSDNTVVKGFWNVFNTITKTKPQIIAAIERKYGTSRSQSDNIKEEIAVAIANGARTEVEILNAIEEEFGLSIEKDNKDQDYANNGTFRTGSNQ